MTSHKRIFLCCSLIYLGYKILGPIKNHSFSCFAFVCFSVGINISTNLHFWRKRRKRKKHFYGSFENYQSFREKKIFRIKNTFRKKHFFKKPTNSIFSSNQEEGRFLTGTNSAENRILLRKMFWSTFLQNDKSWIFKHSSLSQN